MADSKIGILIEAKNKASGALGEVQSQLGGLKKAAGVASKAAAALGVAFAVKQAADMAWELGKASAESARLATAFDGLAQSAGQSGSAILESMRAASRGTINDTALMAAANKAMLLGVADDAEEFTKLLEVASARGKAMGLSTEQAFSDLVTGIGRMSPMILDNLGILTGGEKAFDNYAASIGKTADQLSDAEKKQYLLNAAFASSKDLIASNAVAGDDLASKFERMDASIANAKDSLGALFAPAVAAIAQQLADTVDKVTEAITFDKNVAGAETLIAVYQEVLTAQNKAAKASPEWVQQQIILNDLAGKIEALYKAAGVAAPNLATLTAETDRLDFAAIQATQDMIDLARANDALGVAALNAASKQGALAQAVSATSGIVGQYRGQLLSMVDTLGASGALGSLEKFNSAMQAQALLLEDTMPGAANEERRAFMLQEYANGWLKTNGLIQDHVTGLSAATTQVDTLTSKVASLLSSSLDPGVGVNPADFLPREDAINEDARRLADVAVNGYASPWYEYLNSKFPDLFGEAMNASGGDVSQAAARLLQDFQSGLRPELLDKEAAKARIKAMLVGDANMATLAQEISAELQGELAGQYSAADIAKATGTALGSDKAMSAGLEGTGKAAVTTVTKEIDGAVDLIRTSGEGAGRNWGQGFLATVGEAIPPRLVEILATIVTPGVWERIIAQGGLTMPEGAS